MSHPLDIAVGCIGVGMMGSALARGILKNKCLSRPALLYVYDRGQTKCSDLKDLGATLCDTAQRLASVCDVIFVAVKPKDVDSVLSKIRGEITSEKVVVSVAAGVSIAQLEAGLPAAVPTVRVMPNTPCLVGEGASAYALGTHATAGHGKMISKLLGAVGQVHQVKEGLLDAVTGVSGSGPAYVYMFIEALADGGVRAGLPRNVATALAKQTVRGAATLASSSELHTAELKDAVCSPAGTTIAGVYELERQGMRAAVMAAVGAAAKRAAELGEEPQNKRRKEC